MGIVFQNGRFGIDRGVTVEKGAKETAILQLLRSFLDAKEPSLVHLLVNTWRTQGKAITYKELREAILAGDIDQELWEDWQQDYSRFVVQHMQPAWLDAIDAAAKQLEAEYDWYFNPMADGVVDWVQTRAADFVTNCTQTQIDGIRAVIQRAAGLEGMSVDELARAIRPMVGLTKQQATANLRYYETLRANKIPPKRARESSIYYSARQHRSRAYTIARTELATAYNTGAHEGTKQAQAAGLLGECVKVWSTADDERVCSICGGLDGKSVAMDSEFEGASRSWSTRLHPPAHPGCRCAVMYVEIDSLTEKNS
ncbi:MAG: hypothetical protein IJX71_05970 [Oscillospiraceae bacterium]|nr:hypothetical protein [Oscillospiraceae bacterium]